MTAKAKANEAKPNPWSKQYGDWTITINDDGKFLVSDKEDKALKLYSTIQEAYEYCDRKDKEADAQKKRKVAIPGLAIKRNHYDVVDKTVPVTITGIHSTTGDVLITPKVELSYGTRPMYDLPVVAELIRLQDEAQSRLDAISNSLRLFQAKGGEKDWGRGGSVDHPKAVDALEAHWKAAQELAKFPAEDLIQISIKDDKGEKGV